MALTLLAAGSLSHAANLYWKSDASGSSDFTTTAYWSAAFSASSDSLRVGGPTNSYPYSTNLSKLTTSWGAVDATANDALLVGGYLYEGNFELDCGSGTTAYFRSVIVGDTKISTQQPSVFTVTSGTLSRGNIANDTGYMTVGRNATTASTTNGIGYLNINGGEVNMDRITVGEQKSGTTPDTTYPGEGHVLLQNDGIINLPCEKTFDPVAYVGLRVNNGTFTWNDNGNSSVTTGHLLVNTATLIFQSTDNSFGTDGKGIVVNGGMPAGDGAAEFSTNALVDVTGLAPTTNWVTLVTTAAGITLGDDTLLTPNSVAQGWGYRILDLDGDAGTAAALQVAIVPMLTCSKTGDSLTVSWPSLYLGWTLQQASSPTGTWNDISGTETVSSTTLPINLENAAMFFQLRSPAGEPPLN